MRLHAPTQAPSEARILIPGGAGSIFRRAVAATAVLTAAAATVLLYKQYGVSWPESTRVYWQLSLLACVALIARGMLLGRPVTLAHAVWASCALCIGIALHLLGFSPLGNAALAVSGLLLMAPTTTAPDAAELPRIWPLVAASEDDPLAPFAMHAAKCHYFSADGTAAIAYRTALGYAVVSGDPVGSEAVFANLVADFWQLCRSRGWRMVVLAGSERRARLWQSVLGPHALLTVPIGRDVVIDVADFQLHGRRFRNLRQAVARTHNCGVTTEIVDEQGLDPALVSQLSPVMYASHRAVQTERGFAMNLDGALEGRYPGIKLIVARDRAGRVQAFHRYACAGQGHDVTLDAPYRRPGAPNGVDERLSVDMIAAARSTGVQRLSLAFAPFPELFGTASDTWRHRLAHRLIHALDVFIRLESLYRYEHKFHAFGDRRVVVIRAHHIPVALIVLLWLEFSPRKRHLMGPRAAVPESLPDHPASGMTPSANRPAAQWKSHDAGL